MITPITPEQYNNLRSDNQYSRARLAIIGRNVVHSTTITQPPASSSWPLSFDVASAPSGAIPRGALVLLGSTPGGDDIGSVVVNLVSGTTIHIYPKRGINWAAGTHVTITDEIVIVGNRVRVGADSTYQDNYGAYSGGFAAMSPVPVMGGDSVIHAGQPHQRNGALSWHPLGAAITGYQWACQGAVITGASTATPTITIDTPGVYRLSLTVTAGAVSTTGYRRILVVESGNVRDVSLSGVRCSRDAGGYAANVRVYGEPLAPGTRVALYASDERYGGQAVSMGQVTGCENIILSGVVSDQNYRYDQDGQYTECTIDGWQKALDVYNPQYQIERVLTSPANHVQIQNPTLRKLTWWLVMGATNAGQCLDVLAENVSTGYPTVTFEGASLFNQFSQVARMLGGMAGVDRWGRLIISVRPELAAARTAVMTLSADDIDAEYQISEPNEHERAITLTAISCAPYANPETLYSVAPGIANTASETLAIETLLANGQDSANALAGRLYASENNRATLRATLRQNNRLIGIWPAQVVEYEDVQYAPVDLADDYDDESGAWSVSITAERINPQGPAETGIAPVATESGEIIDITIPTIDTPPSIIIPPPPEIPEDPAETEQMFAGRVIIAAYNKIYYTDTFSDPLAPTWLQASGIPDGIGSINHLFAHGDAVYAASRLGIWKSNLADMVFSRLIGVSDIERYYDNEPNFYAAGVDSLDGTVLAVAGVGYAYGNLAHLYQINSGGGVSRKILTRFADVPFGGRIGRTPDGILIASYYHNFDSNGVIVKFGSGYSEDTITLTGLNGLGFPVWRHGAARWFFVRYGDGLVYITTDSAAFTSTPIYGSRAVSYYQNRIVAIDNYGKLKYTDDDGINQVTVTIPSRFVPFQVHCISASEWIMAGHLTIPLVGNILGVYHTDDSGATWWPKYNNLPEMSVDGHPPTAPMLVLES